MVKKTQKELDDLDFQVIKKWKEDHICESCGKYLENLPSKICPGCQAYQEHIWSLL